MKFQSRCCYSWHFLNKSEISFLQFYSFLLDPPQRRVQLRRKRRSVNTKPCCAELNRASVGLNLARWLLSCIGEKGGVCLCFIIPLFNIKKYTEGRGGSWVMRSRAARCEKRRHLISFKYCEEIDILGGEKIKLGTK